MDSQANGTPENNSPPAYTEATNPCTSANPLANAERSEENSVKLPMTPLNTSATVMIMPSPLPSPQLSAASSVAEELSALQRAHLHLYKRMQAVKTQTYAALVVVLLLAGVVMAFLIAYGSRHHAAGKTLLEDLPNLASGNGGQGSYRSGKALVAATASLVHDNSLSEHFIGQARHANENHRVDWNDALENDTLVNANANKTLITTTVVPVVSTTTTTTTLPPTTISTKVPVITKTTISTIAKPVLYDSSASLGGSIHSSDVNASVSISLPGTYKLSILIHKASVPNMDSLIGKASDTYCDVYIDEVNVGSTTVIDNDNHPNWQYLFPKPFIVKRESNIRIDLIDVDNIKKDHIGGVRVSVDELIKSERLNRPVRLFHGKGDIWVTFKLD